MVRNRFEYTRASTARAAIIGMIVSALFSHFAHAGGKTGADFLKIPIGAEPAGLGQAYTALAHGIDALNWNPAGILRTPTYLQRPSIGLSFSHQDQLADNNLDHLGIIIPNRGPGRSAWGLDLVRLSYAQQQGRDPDGNPTDTFGASDLAFGAAYAHTFATMQVGTQLKLIRQDLAGRQADGFALDIGFLSASPLPALSLGAAARNIGPRMKFVHEQFDLPLALSFGAAYRLSPPLTLAFDVQYKPYQRQTVMAMGTQIAANSRVTLRAGYLAKLADAVTNTQQSETDRGSFIGVGGLAGGIGFRLKSFSLDYSITPFGELGNTQLLTLSTWFGAEEDRAPAGNHLDFETTPAPDDRVILILPAVDEAWWNRMHP